jgi:hypothetical protein
MTLPISMLNNNFSLHTINTKLSSQVPQRGICHVVNKFSSKKVSYVNELYHTSN